MWLAGWPPGGASVAVAVSVGVVERRGEGRVQRCWCSTKEKHEMLAVLLGVLARELPGCLCSSLLLDTAT